MEDPHVRVIGMPDAVTEASRLIQYELKPFNKITMKLEVPWTCHSHIIGKGGNTIQPVVKRTGVSIHFPDGNKNSDQKKSNCVSINSRREEVAGLEEARRSIRDLTPLTFMFSLPPQLVAVVDTSLLLVHIQNTYNVQVELKLVNDKQIDGSVKGTDWDAVRVKEATFSLLQALCGNIAPQISVHVTLDIMEQNHPFVMGRNNEQIKKIMHRTATKITFPDHVDPRLSPLQRNTVTITGGIDNVYMARQNIIGSLPLVLLFDMTSECALDQKEVAQIMQTLDVGIYIKNQRLDGKRSVVIRGPERNAPSIYEAWKVLARNCKPPIKATIPADYYLPTPSVSPLGMGMVTQYPPSQVILSPVDGSGLCRDSCCSSLTDSDPSLYNPAQPLSLPPCEGTDLFANTCSIDDASLAEEVKSLMKLIPDRRAPGCEKKVAVTDYITKKMLAAKLMKQPVVPEEPRTPTDTWSGYGLSKSQPAYVINQMKRQEKVEMSHWQNLERSNSGGSNCSSALTESTTSELASEKVNQMMYGCELFSNPKYDMKAASAWFDSGLLGYKTQTQTQCSDLSSILVELQLEQYYDLFVAEDIDIDTFLSLTDEDLKDIGVSVFGHRKKLLMTIKNLCLRTRNQY